MRFRKRVYKDVTQQVRDFRTSFGKEVFATFGGQVQYGPLKGFRIVDEFSWGGASDITTKTFGLYEQQNLPIFQSSQKTCLVDIGAADGFWGAGLVFAGIFDQSLCFEISPRSQRIIRRTARANGILNKVSIHGLFTQDSGEDIEKLGYAAEALFFLIDIEGAEYDLLTPEMLSRYAKSEFLIELHAPSGREGSIKQERLLENAEKHFDVTLVNDAIRDASALESIADIPDEMRRAILSEGRGYAMQWLHLTPRAGRKRTKAKTTGPIIKGFASRRA